MPIRRLAFPGKNAKYPLELAVYKKDQQAHIGLALRAFPVFKNYCFHKGINWVRLQLLLKMPTGLTGQDLDSEGWIRQLRKS